MCPRNALVAKYVDKEDALSRVKFKIEVKLRVQWVVTTPGQRWKRRSEGMMIYSIGEPRISFNSRSHSAPRFNLIRLF
jgi:hypothetical protein